jgi:ABC-type Zn uptake system ZnuABC Zn-binding protein ZnuA
MDPRNAIHMAKRIRDAVMTADPTNAAAYRANTTAFVEELEALDDELRAQIARVPLAKRRIVTDHDAFRYLADRYRITIVGSALPSLVAGAEPNARELTDLADRIKNQGVRVLFAEAAVDPAVARALADEAGITVAGVLWGDSLGGADSEAATYVGMMRSNMTVIVNGILGG